MAIKPSLRFALLLLLFHAIVASVIFATVMPLVARLSMVMLILLSLLYYLARDALLLLPDSWSEFTFDQGRGSVITRNGSAFSGEFAGRTIVSSYVAVLSVRREGRRKPVSRAILPDALDTGEFRKLCVHLRFAQKLP